MKLNRVGKAVAALGAVALAAGLAGCAAEADNAAEENASEAENETLSIAFVMGAESDPFFQAMKLGAEQEAEAQGVELIWQGDPSNYSPETQIPIVDNVLAQDPDALVLIPTDPTALQASVTKAVDAGIVVANVDTRVGDLMTCRVGGSLPHIGILSSQRDRQGRWKAIHNIGLGTLEDSRIWGYGDKRRFRFLPA